MAKRHLPFNNYLLPTYRVREGIYESCNGYSCHRKRGFLAERRVLLFWCISIWWPLRDGDWRDSASSAKSDIDRDAGLRLPLSEPQVFRVH